MINEAEPSIFRTELARVLPRDRDAWLDQRWRLAEIPDDDPELPRGCVPYLPCPVATVLAALDAAEVTSRDVFVDIGSGAGRTVLLARLLSGATCLGLEIQPTLVAAARKSADALGLDRTEFIAGDAADALRLVAHGSVFFLYCPFGGERLERLLDDLQVVAGAHPIRICCVQMPPLVRPWLERLPSATVELEAYRSTR